MKTFNLLIIQKNASLRRKTNSLWYAYCISQKNPERRKETKEQKLKNKKSYKFNEDVTFNLDSRASYLINSSPPLQLNDCSEKYIIKMRVQVDVIRIAYLQKKTT